MSNLQKTEIHLLDKEHLLIVLPHPQANQLTAWALVEFLYLPLLVHKSGLPLNINRFECSWKYYVL